LKGFAVEPWAQLISQGGLNFAMLVALAMFYRSQQQKIDDRNVAREDKTDQRLETLETYVRDELQDIIAASNKCVDQCTVAIIENTRVMGAVKDHLGMQKQKLDSISGKLNDIGH
jgi:hypothetical protein